LLTGKNILIADDNKLNQKIVAFALQKSGAIVKTANNGKEAIEFLKNNDCAAILMDLQMPEMDGIDACIYIRTVMKRTLPIIGLTANTMFGEAEKCIEAGMNGCVSKPFEVAELYEILENSLK